MTAAGAAAPNVSDVALEDRWSYEEFCRTPFHDKRCLTTFVLAAEQLADQAEVSLSQALGGRRRAVSHTFHDHHLDAHGLLSGHIAATALRCQEYSRQHPLGPSFVLIASDTTSFDFTRHPAICGLGPVSDKEYQRGFLTHSALAMTPVGDPLGLLYQENWTRDPENAGSAEKRHERDFEDKESYKWLEALRGVERALPPEQSALLIQDSEADIFEFFAAPRRDSIHLLIRAKEPRRIDWTIPDHLDDPQPHTLREAASLAPIVGRKSVSIPAHSAQNGKKARKAREAHLTVRLLRVAILPAHSKADSMADSPSAKANAVPVWVVRAAEENPPADVEEPIVWVLLTTLPHVDAAVAQDLIQYYTLRWRIERFHFILKSGCRFEKLQCDTLSAMYKALSLYNVVAWRMLKLAYLAQLAPERAEGGSGNAPTADEVVTPMEQEVLQAFAQAIIHTAHDALMAIACIAGFVSVPSAPTPGVKAIWTGFRKLQDIIRGYLLALASPRCSHAGAT